MVSLCNISKSGPFLYIINTKRGDWLALGAAEYKQDHICTLQVLRRDQAEAVELYALNQGIKFSFTPKLDLSSWWDTLSISSVPASQIQSIKKNAL